MRIAPVRVNEQANEILVHSGILLFCLTFSVTMGHDLHINSRAIVVRPEEVTLR